MWRRTTGTFLESTFVNWLFRRSEDADATWVDVLLSVSVSLFAFFGVVWLFVHFGP